MFLFFWLQIMNIQYSSFFFLNGFQVCARKDLWLPKVLRSVPSRASIFAPSIYDLHTKLTSAAHPLSGISLRLPPPPNIFCIFNPLIFQTVSAQVYYWLTLCLKDCRMWTSNQMNQEAGVCTARISRSMSLTI